MAGKPPYDLDLSSAYGLVLRASRRIGRVWRLVTDKGVYALKCALPPQEAIFLRAAETHLAAAGFTRFPRPIETRAGGPELLLPNGERYVLREWLPGRWPLLDPGHPRDIALLGGIVAQFHRASLGFHGPAGSRRAWESWPATLTIRLHQMQLFTALSNGGGFDRLYLRAVSAAIEEAVAARQLLAAADYRGLARGSAAAGGLCHGDLAAKNALLDRREAYLLDLDRAEENVFAADLAMLGRRILAEHGWRPEIFLHLLQEYDRVRRLSVREVRATIALLHWPQPIWRLGYQYHVEHLERPVDFFLHRLQNWTDHTGPRLNFFLYCLGKLW